MRLLNISTLELSEFGEDNVPHYVIASHRWTTDETTYKDVKKQRNQSSTGYQKVQGFCSFMKRTNIKTTRSMRAFGIDRNCQWLWIDTACIDKKSSAELSESINSMLHYYASSELCYAYLQDVELPESLQFTQSVWFRRGWTLQELLAPRTVVFLSRNWEIIGHKCQPQACDMSCRAFGVCLNSRISRITGIPEDFLSYDWSKDCMSDVRTPTLDLVKSWTSMRSTERVEDGAYCLLGLLGINLVPIYGERENAWNRLYEEYDKKQKRREEKSSTTSYTPSERVPSAPIKSIETSEEVDTDFEHEFARQPKTFPRAWTAANNEAPFLDFNVRTDRLVDFSSSATSFGPPESAREDFASEFISSRPADDEADLRRMGTDPLYRWKLLR